MLCLVWWFFIMSLFSWKVDFWREGLRERKKFCWLTPQMVTTARDAPIQIQDPGDSSGVSCMGAGTHMFESSSPAFPTHKQGARECSRQNTHLSYGMLGLQMGEFTNWATVQAPGYVLCKHFLPIGGTSFHFHSNGISISATQETWMKFLGSWHRRSGYGVYLGIDPVMTTLSHSVTVSINK